MTDIGLYNYFDSKQLTTWMHVAAFAVSLVHLVSLQYRRPNVTHMPTRFPCT